MVSPLLKAAPVAALLFSTLSFAGALPPGKVLETDPLIHCELRSDEVLLTVISQQYQGSLTLITHTGNRLSYYASPGATLTYRLDSGQLPLTLTLEEAGGEQKVEVSCLESGN